MVIDAILARDPASQVIIFDDRAESDRPPIFGIPVLRSSDGWNNLRGCAFVLGIGDNVLRTMVATQLREGGYVIKSVLHPQAVIANGVEIGDGAFVGAGSVVMADARLGAIAIVNTSASIDHDCDIGAAAHIAPGAHLCGNIRVGARTLVGVGTCIRPGVSICDDVVLGAGSVVIQDIREAGTFIGNPARSMRHDD